MAVADRVLRRPVIDAQTVAGELAIPPVSACTAIERLGGVVYSINGFQAAADFAGEARNPRRTVPLAIIAGIGLAVLVYLAL